MGLNVAVRESEHPLDSFQIQSLNARVVPRLVGMAQGRGEHPALAIALHPRDRKVAIGALHVWIGEIELAGIEPQQNPLWASECSTGTCFGVPLYRQRLRSGEAKGDVQRIQMMGANLWQRSSLTADNGVYYIDTTVGAARQTKDTPGAIRRAVWSAARSAWACSRSA